MFSPNDFGENARLERGNPDSMAIWYESIERAREATTFDLPEGVNHYFMFHVGAANNLDSWTKKDGIVYATFGPLQNVQGHLTYVVFKRGVKGNKPPR